MERTINICRKAAIASNNYEKENSKIKKQFILRNIEDFNEIAKKAEGFKGSFGTGYPFYALGPELTGDLPIIGEQIDYNNKLLETVKNTDYKNWTCSECIAKNYKIMPDLKQVCKLCPNMDDELKPRKVINRLPDIDMWMVCESDRIKKAKDFLVLLFKIYNFRTSDVNPVETIDDVIEISSNIKNGIMPDKNLPLDAHIIPYEDLINLISQVPQKIKEANSNGTTPYLPILPLSYRKSWQKDDTAYNFIHDFLSSLTEYNFDGDLLKILKETRRVLANKYSFEQLYDFLMQTGPDSVKRRHTTSKPENILKLTFKERIDSWKN